MTLRRLVVNADDFGQSRGVNAGIMAAVDGGVVTSASLMVRWPCAAEAAEWARARPGLSLGLHIDLGEWVYREGAWVALYDVVDAQDPLAVAEEFTRQLAAFQRLVGRPPSHLDGHQHVQRREPVRSLVLAEAARLGIPARGLEPSVTYCGGFYGQSGRGEPYPEGVTLAALLSLLDGLGPGTSELGCHPGADVISDLDSPYRAERGVERVVLCDPCLPAALAERGIQLCSFLDWSGHEAVAELLSGPCAPGLTRETRAEPLRFDGDGGEAGRLACLPGE